MSQISENYRSMAKAAAKALQDCYYRKNLGIYYDSDANWWTTAVALEGIIDYMSLNGSTEYHDVISNIFELAPKTQNSPNFLNSYYDDEGWWAIAWIKAYDLTQEPRYLSMAETIFADMTKGWETETCGGGIWWKKPAEYKAAIQNELFLVVAARLHLRTDEDNDSKSYRDWAHDEWTWFKKTGMINSINLVNNGLDEYCQNDKGTTWTYNQGVILGGLVDLYRITKNYELLAQAQAIAQTAIYTLCYANGVLQEPCEPRDACDKDQECFKGIFMRYLAYLYSNLKMLDINTLETVKAETLKLVSFADLKAINAPGYDILSYYEKYITLNADSIWNNARNRDNQFGMRWVGPFDGNNVPKQLSALAALNAAIPFDNK